MSEDQESGESWFSCRRAPYRLLYRGISTIAETIEPIQSKNLRETLHDVKRKFAEIEKEKELAI